ncbi:MAG: hypothetical protein LAP87_05655 [Acidobacteriia bacterium]|nr:hypothetical protein [Terriglobia bacterium]
MRLIGKETDRETESWEVIGLEGSTYRKLVMRNDQPLAAKEEKREVQRLAEEAERRRKETPEERHNRLFSVTYSYQIPYDRLVDVFDLRYLGEKEIDGRKAFGVEAVPKADLLPANENERESRNYRLVLWLDFEDCYPAHIDGEITGEHSRLQKGTVFRLDEIKLPHGTRMLAGNTVRYAVKFLKLHTVHGEAVRTYSDYHKFQADPRFSSESEGRGGTRSGYRLAGERRPGIDANNARRTALTDSAFLNTRATSGSSSIATDPGCIRWANRFGLALL